MQEQPNDGDNGGRAIELAMKPDCAEPSRRVDWSLSSLGRSGIHCWPLGFPLWCLKITTVLN